MINILNYLSIFSHDHALFRAAVELCDVNECENEKYAMVSINKQGRIQLHINPHFWRQANYHERVFVLAHELLHVVFGHLSNNKNMKQSNPEDHELWNIAYDVTINEYIEHKLLLTRDHLSKEFRETACFHENVFANRPDVEKKKNSSYYFIKLKEKSKSKSKSKLQYNKIKICKNPESITKINTNLQKIGLKKDFYNEKNLYQKHIKKIENKKIFLKKKWETVINHWCRKSIDNSQTEKAWGFQSRRAALLNSNLITKGDKKGKEIRYKNNIHLYLDISGSCQHLAHRFYNMARSIDSKHFDVNVFCFNTLVYPVDLKKQNHRVGGGTLFSPISENINKQNKKPDAVFIFTDGEAELAKFKNPEKIHWFLEGTNPETSAIPTQSIIHHLIDFA